MADSEIAEAPEKVERRDRLLPWIAAERGLRALALLAVGIVLITHPHANWAFEVKRLSRESGLDPNSRVIRRILDVVRKVPANENAVFGAIALAYGALEAAECYGLARRRRWGEWLTLVATSILLVPEVWELVRGATLLKAGAFIVNLLVVGYLYWRLRRRSQSRAE
jgi:uncharacterized membrane protein (DUF2068 family)